MRFLTPAEWQEWCAERQVPLGEAGWLRPDLRAKGFHVVELQYPIESGRKIYLAGRLMALLESQEESLILVDDWGVFPSNQHLPLFTRFREALGERRPLIEAPGHLADGSEADDAVSIVAMSLMFFWDCYGISSNGRNAFYTSHDEYCYFASRD